MDWLFSLLCQFLICDSVCVCVYASSPRCFFIILLSASSLVCAWKRKESQERKGKKRYIDGPDLSDFRSVADEVIKKKRKGLYTAEKGREIDSSCDFRIDLRAPSFYGQAFWGRNILPPFSTEAEREEGRKEGLPHWRHSSKNNSRRKKKKSRRRRRRRPPTSNDAHP